MNYFCSLLKETETLHPNIPHAFWEIPCHSGEDLFCQELPFPPLPGGAPGSAKHQMSQCHFHGSPNSSSRQPREERRRQDLETICYPLKVNARDSHPCKFDQVKWYLEVCGKVKLCSGSKHNCSFQGSLSRRKLNSGQPHSIYVHNSMYACMDGRIVKYM